MSVMQKLLEINDHLVRTLAECEQLRNDQKTLREISSVRLQRITELQDELRKACAERDEAKENAGRLQAERDELRKEQSKLQSICADGGRRITELKAELDATRKQLQDVLFEQEDISSVEPAGQSDLVRDVSHYIEAAEVDRPTTIHPPEYTPPEGWRVLHVGEELRQGDVRVDDSGACSAVLVTVNGVVPHGRRYIRPIEPQPEQDGVLVQEGWWLQADGNRVYVRPTNPTASNKGKIAQGYVWSDGARLYHSDGGHGDTPTPHDLVKFLGKHVKTQPAEPQQSQPEPVQVSEGRWRTRSGKVRYVTAMPTDHEDFVVSYPWWDGDVRTWANNGLFFNGQTAGEDLVAYLGPLKQEPQPKPESKSQTFAAYIVGDKSQPDALRIVWATEEWIQYAKFGIVHRISDLQFSGNDTFTPDQFSMNLKIQ